MDLGLYLRVLARFRVLVAGGAVVALLLAIISLVKVDPSGSSFISYRQSEQWVSSTKLFVTEPGFPWGSLRESQSFDPARLTSLAFIYAQLADSDPVKAIVRHQGPIKGHVEISTVPAGPNSDADLPFINIAAFSTSPEAAKALARRQAAAFSTYLRSEQARKGIPPEQRVQLDVVQRPLKAELDKGRSKTLPIVIFLTVMIAVIGLAFLLENMRPRIRAVSVQQQHDLEAEAGQAGYVA
jgi:hypothetical protein